MGRNGPPFDQDKSARGKRTTLRGSFDGLDVAMGLTSAEKDGEDGTGGAGGEPAAETSRKSFTELARAAGMNLDEDVVEKGGVPMEDTQGAEVASAPESALYPGPDVISTDAPAPIVVEQPVSSGERKRDPRSSRGGGSSTGRGVRAGQPKDRAEKDVATPDTVPVVPVVPVVPELTDAEKQAELKARLKAKHKPEPKVATFSATVPKDALRSAEDSDFRPLPTGEFNNSAQEVHMTVRDENGVEIPYDATKGGSLMPSAINWSHGNSEYRRPNEYAYNPADATPAETAAALAASVQRHEAQMRPDQQERQRKGSEAKFLAANPELHEKAEGAKEAYFQALRSYQRSRSLLDAGQERLGFKKANDKEGPANLQALKRSWLESRMEVAKARLESVVIERERRDGVNPNRSKLDNDAVLARFQRRYVVRDAVMGATAEETKMRAEALSSRDKNLIEWTFKAYDGLPEGVKDFVTQFGIGVGVVGVSAGAAGLVAAGGIGAAAFAPILFAAGLGLKWRADALALKKKADMGEAAGRASEEVQKLRAAQQALESKARFTTFSGLAGLATEVATRWFQKDTRKQAEAGFTLRDEAGNIGSTGVGDLRSTDADAFETLARSVDRAYASTKQADALLGTTTTVGSLVGGAIAGAGYGAIVHGVDSMVHHDAPPTTTTGEHPPAAHPPVKAEQTPPPPAVAEAAPAAVATPPEAAVPAPGAATAPGEAVPAPAHPTDAAPAAPTTPGDAAPAAPVAPPEAVPGAVPGTHPTAPNGLLGQPAVIDASGEGFGQLVVDLKQSLASVENPSPALKHFLDTNVNEINHDILAAKDGSSLTMQPGDKAFFDNDQNMWVHRQGSEPQLVFENSPSAPGGFIEHDIHGHMQVDGGVRPEAVSPAPAAPAEAPVTATPATTEAVVPPASPDSGVTISTGQETIVTDGGITIEPAGALVGNNGVVEVTPGGSIVPEGSIVLGDTAPQPEQAPVAPPAPAPVEQAPVAVPAPEARVEIPHTPLEALTGGAAFTNGHSIEITPATPEMYFSPTANGEVGYMYGGAPGTAFEAAKQYILENPGSSVRFFDVNVDGITGIRVPVTGALMSDGAGGFQPLFNDPATNAPFPPPDLDAVTRKVDFNYRPVR